ncbi:MAG: hypothetical protein WDN00_01695 [Limisphaerales bacterium]
MEQPPAVNLNNEKAVMLNPVILLEGQTNSAVRESFLIIQDSHSRSNRTVTVQAGYGQIWNEKSTLQKISLWLSGTQLRLCQRKL